MFSDAELANIIGRFIYGTLRISNLAIVEFEVVPGLGIQVSARRDVRDVIFYRVENFYSDEWTTLNSPPPQPVVWTSITQSEESIVYNAEGMAEVGIYRVRTAEAVRRIWEMTLEEDNEEEQT